MSAETTAALDNAIREHIASEHDGAHTVGWVLLTAHVTGDDLNENRTGYHRYTPEGQPFHVSVGLTEIGNHMVADIWNDDEA